MKRSVVVAVLLALIGLALSGAAASDGATAPGGQFDGPGALATDGAGNVYVVDAGNRRIQKFTSSGKFLAQWGREGSGKGEFVRAPGGIAVDGSGDVYVTESTDQQEGRLGNRVQKFTLAGQFLAEWGRAGTGPGELYYPSDIAIGPSGDAYVTDSGNSRVESFTADGSFVAQWGSRGTGHAQFDWPTGIAADAAGDVYVANSNVVAFLDGDYRIEKFDAAGGFVTEWGSTGHGDGQFQALGGVAVDAAGDVYVVDSGNYRVEKFTADGQYITQWGGKGSGDGRFEGPSGIAIDPAGDVFVSDALGNRIEKFTADGAFLGAWGHGAPAHPGRRRLVIPATLRQATFRATCPHARRCTAAVTIAAGGKVLARGRYSLPPHGSAQVHVALTAAGQAALAGKRRLRAKLTIVDTRTQKSKSLPIVLSR